MNEPEGFAHSMTTFNCIVAGVYTTPAVQADYSVSDVTQQEIREENQLTTPSFFRAALCMSVRLSQTAALSTGLNISSPVAYPGFYFEEYKIN